MARLEPPSSYLTAINRPAATTPGRWPLSPDMPRRLSMTATARFISSAVPFRSRSAIMHWRPPDRGHRDATCRLRRLLGLSLTLDRRPAPAPESHFDTSRSFAAL